MKRLFFTLSLLFVFTSLFAVEYKEELTFEKEFETEPSIKIAKLWVSDNFRSGKDVIDVYDEELKVLTGNGLCSFNKGLITMNYRFKFKISVKGNKLKIVFNNFTVGAERNKPQAKSVGVNDFMEKLEEMAQSIFDYYEDF